MSVDKLYDLIRSANRSDIARRTGIHLSHVSRVLSGKRAASADNIQQISGYMGVSMDDLYRALTVIRAEWIAAHPKSVSKRTLRRFDALHPAKDKKRRSMREQPAA